LLATAVFVLVLGFAPSADAEMRCNPDGDELVCDNAERPVIDPYYPRPRLSPWRNRPSEIDGPREPWMLDGTQIDSPDGRVCWPHGDHFHCR
jgi:hypothetical protein